jgi:hypothetical protein
MQFSFAAINIQKIYIRHAAGIQDHRAITGDFGVRPER